MDLPYYAEAFSTQRGRCFRFVASPAISRDNTTGLT
jgi:hypothetical protein